MTTAFYGRDILGEQATIPGNIISAIAYAMDFLNDYARLIWCLGHLLNFSVCYRKVQALNSTPSTLTKAVIRIPEKDAKADVAKMIEVE